MAAHAIDKEAAQGVAREQEEETEQEAQSLPPAGLLDVSDDALLYICGFLPRRDFVCVRVFSWFGSTALAMCCPLYPQLHFMAVT